jgi:hypothetical protein
MIGIAQQKRDWSSRSRRSKCHAAKALGPVQNQLLLHNPLDISAGTLELSSSRLGAEESRRLY